MIKGRVIFNLFGFSWCKIPWKVQIPENFDELSTKQLHFWVEKILPNVSDWFEIEDDKVSIKNIDSFTASQLEACRVILGVPLWLFNSLSTETLRNLIYEWKITDFLISTSYAPKENPVKQIGGYFGPTKTDHFIPWEFSFADAFYLRYKSSKEDADLDLFIAQFYRPYKQPDMSHEKFTTDLRESYNHESDFMRLPKISKASKAKKLLFLYWYEQWRNSLPKMFKYLFKTENSKKAAKQQSWLPVFTSASNGIQNLETIKYMNLMVLFFELNQVMKRQEEHKKELEAQRTKRK